MTEQTPSKDFHHDLILGREYYQKGDHDRALEHLTRVIESGAAFADVFNMAGVIYHGRNEFPLAQKYLAKALNINPNYTEAALNLAIVYTEMGKYDEAHDVFHRASDQIKQSGGKMDPFVKGKIANMYADIGDVYRSMGLNQEAIEEYRRALSLGPTFSDIRVKLAVCYRDTGEVEAAVQELEQAVEVSPNYVEARNQLGLSLFAAGQKERAQREWEGVLKVDPLNRSAGMYLRVMETP